MTDENPRSPYQVFDPLPPEVYNALREDIERHGVRDAVVLDGAGNILDGNHRAAIAKELDKEFKTVTYPFTTDAEKIEFAIKANLLRRHVGPIAWAKAFKKLMEIRGIERGTKHNRHTPREATIAALGDEVGVKERTARARLKLLDDLARYPDLSQKVDTGEMSAKEAREVMCEREGTTHGARAPQPNRNGKGSASACNTNKKAQKSEQSAPLETNPETKFHDETMDEKPQDDQQVALVTQEQLEAIRTLLAHLEHLVKEFRAQHVCNGHPIEEVLNSLEGAFQSASGLLRKATNNAVKHESDNTEPPKHDGISMAASEEALEHVDSHTLIQST
jgi:hypothetical protein